MLNWEYFYVFNFDIVVLQKFIIFPDISVFVGARSDFNQTNWFWNSGTMVNNLMFPISNKSVCQEMTWPLTYDDGVNLRGKNCASGKAYYLCKMLCKFVLTDFIFNLTTIKCWGISKMFFFNLKHFSSFNNINECIL